jgi:hypothetical protein
VLHRRLATHGCWPTAFPSPVAVVGLLTAVQSQEFGLASGRSGCAPPHVIVAALAGGTALTRTER